MQIDVTVVMYFRAKNCGYTPKKHEKLPGFWVGVETAKNWILYMLFDI